MKSKPCRCCDGTGRELDHASVGAAMRALRRQRGLSIRALAPRMKLSANYLSDLENGHRYWRDDLVERYKAAIAQ